MKAGEREGKMDTGYTGKDNGKTNEKKVDPDIKVVLNGGKREMDAATIPIQWFFSKEVIEKKPEYLLFFEQNKKEVEEGLASAREGHRYVCRVSEGTKFI